MRKFQFLLRKAPVLIWRTRAIWIRGFFCWLIGIAFLVSDDLNNHDFRLQLRGSRLKSSDVVLVLISEGDWASISGPGVNLMRPLKEVGYLTDSYFWHEETWVLLLNQILSLDPAAIGVSFFFGENISASTNNLYHRRIFENPHILWSSRLDSEGRIQMPRFSRDFGQNTGLISLPTDSDGVVRRFTTPPVQANLMSTKLASFARNDSAPMPRDLKTPPINFQGPPGTFPALSFQQLMQGTVPLSEIKGKIVIVGARDAADHLILTPLGPMTKAELIANMTSISLRNRWINNFPNSVYILWLLGLVIVSFTIMSYYPQSVAMVFLIGLGAMIISLSIWVFDAFNFWTPIRAPIGQLILSFVIFQSYQLAFNERRTWELEQERKFLREVEQTKNNFVSLISHDLKNPIAKIQAIVDRLLRTFPVPELQLDLENLRKSSNELYRYIQSILQVTRVEATQFQLRKEAADINEIIQRVAEEMDTLFKERNIQLALRLEPMFSIELDVGLIQEVILNLIENALKYSPVGGTVEVVSEEINNEVVVTVKDTGDGIDPDEQAQVWNKFYRGKKHEMQVKGTGLGLYLVKYFVELHGGSVFLKSSSQTGTEIGFRLPVGQNETTSEDEESAIDG